MTRGKIDGMPHATLALSDAPDEAAPAFRVRVFGYAPIVAGLLRAARADAFGQAYLLVGPPGVGKRTLARLFAQALTCSAAEAADRPCGACASCRQVAHGTSPDLEIAPSPLRIEDARALQGRVALAPAGSRHRVVILPEIDRASLGAANSLLKTLEEPPPHAVILLTAAQPGDVLPTIRSRCRVVVLPAQPVADVAAALTAGWGVPADRADWLARLSAGRLGWAVRAHADPALLEGRERWLTGLAAVLGGDVAGRLSQAAQLAADGGVPADGLAHWSGWWRDLLLVQHAVPEPVVNRDRLAELQSAARRFAAADVVRALEAVELALRRLAANGNPQLTLEVLALDLPA